MLEVRNLRKAYGELVAVDDVSFSLEPGQLLGLLGPNGAGKRSFPKLLKCLNFSNNNHASLSSMAS